MYQRDLESASNSSSSDTESDQGRVEASEEVSKRGFKFSRQPVSTTKTTEVTPRVSIMVDKHDTESASDEVSQEDSDDDRVVFNRQPEPAVAPPTETTGEYLDDFAKYRQNKKIDAIHKENKSAPPTEPKLKGMFRVQLINDEGVSKPWEDRYIDLSKGGLIMKESADDRITRGNLHLYDIVFCELAEDLVTADTPYVIQLKTRSRSTWIFILDSQSTLDEWINVISTNKGKMSEEEWNTPPPPPPTSRFSPQKDSYTLKTFFENRRLLGGMWMIYLFFLWIIVLAVLFILLWKLYVAPFKNMETETSSCLVLNQDVQYLLKKNYNIVMDVQYDVNGTLVTSTMKQLCQGNKCPSYAESEWPVNEYSTCYYDVDDIHYVFFEKQPMMNMRYQITFGVCGGLLAPWLIFVLTMLVVSRKWIKRVVKNGCW
ncbi:hypothetical protein PPL_07827 [Heterostelium album PN500]|uniref:PH domain-containing protein n=1 Tax=Heterostelium pallidum (strain ATCC 26659 / Pp 5 / PN500) TaxID=670386 RepID=D3BH25_HETP5|nr:hypothetical protein PPL_07827 [Heterostelium album PN500]EFA79409.1 hypothetical protein PPL_07827 [Heterostelium album PN500]|eukprot:XP_020431530.1 hypothetical protein PPL_07827 [Heterostelium album PN500]